MVSGNRLWWQQAMASQAKLFVVCVCCVALGSGCEQACSQCRHAVLAARPGVVTGQVWTGHARVVHAAEHQADVNPLSGSRHPLVSRLGCCCMQLPLNVVHLGKPAAACAESHLYAAMDTKMVSSGATGAGVAGWVAMPCTAVVMLPRRMSAASLANPVGAKVSSMSSVCRWRRVWPSSGRRWWRSCSSSSCR